MNGMNQNLLRLAGVALADVLTTSGPADAKLGAFFRGHRELGTKDRAFIAESIYGVLRRKRWLAYLSDGEDPRKLLVAWLVRVQGNSLRDLDEVLNKQQKEWAQEIKAKSTDGLSLAEQVDLPDWLYERLLASHGERLPELVRALNRPAPLDLRVNPLSAEREAILAQLATEGLAAEATPYSPLGIRLKDKPALQKHPLFLEGQIEVQDEGSQLLGYLMSPKRGEMVCDFCAGAGGKTMLLGALMRSTGRLYAFDVSEKRLNNLKPRLKRSGLSNVQAQLIANERDTKIKRLAGKFDRVLVDAPCSGTGTLRRNPDLKWRQTPEALAELNAKQANILNSAATLVKTGGRLVYATCSLLREENEAIVEAFLAGHPGFKLVPAGEALAAQHIELAMDHYLRLDTALHSTDAFFAAVLERTA